MPIDKITEQKILDRSRIEDFLTDLRKTGKDLYTKCPKCGKTGKAKGLIISPVKQVGKCFSCDLGFKGAAGYLLKVKNLTYPDALEEMARHYSIDLETDKEKKKRLKTSEKKDTFLEKQLRESGLMFKDIESDIIKDDRTTATRIPFRVGTRDQYGYIRDGEGDDMLIEYYDLDGHQVQYKHPRKELMLPLVRIRWQNPDLNLDKEGRPIKYQSPSGSGSHLYIPEKIRKKYKYRRQIETLFIQEGEKKAEKACKHGIDSVGIMGIQNLGYNKQLPAELQYIIQQCQVKHVMFILDADWNLLSNKLKTGDKVDQRPLSFFYAVKNYKEYMRTLVNLGMAVEIYFGYIQPTVAGAANAKGIDDLLVRVLREKEDKLKADIDFAMHAKDGTGQYIQVHKITQVTDKQLADLWLLNDAEKFVELHKVELEGITEFKVGKLMWRFGEEGKLELAQPLLPEETFYEEHHIPGRNGSDPRTELSFNYVRCMNFLQNRGYFKYRKPSQEWEIIRIENRIVESVDHWHVKDFVKEFCRELKREDVMNMLMRGGPQYLGPEKLSNLDFFWPNFERAGRESQCLFFKSKMWEIYAHGIKQLEYSQMKNFVWSEKIIDFDATECQSLLKVIRITPEMVKEQPELIPGEFLVEITELGMKCDFLVFLKNTSLYTWKRKENNEDITIEESLQNNRHLVNKLTAMGFLLHDWKNPSELKAVIGMDGKISEVGLSNGRTGKSLFGTAIEHVIPQTYIGAKSKRLVEDPFIFGEVTEKTRNIFIDDARANADFEYFFTAITGKLKVNPKGGEPFTIDMPLSPKIYFNTNHALNGVGASHSDRQAFMAFSDFYNDKRKPVDISGRNFFGEEWDHEQWNLFYNLMATCLVLYFRAMDQGWGDRVGQGIVPPPLENIELRMLRQAIGEDFLMWAEEYYAPPTSEDEYGKRHLNERETRKDLYNDFLDKFSHARKYVTASSFGRRMKDFCVYKGYHFNPHRPNSEGVDFVIFNREFPGTTFIGEPDKSGGIEYLIIADNNFRSKF
jgi:DNA primase